MTLQPAGTKNALTLEDLAPYPRLSYEQGEHNSFYFSEEILSTLDSKAMSAVRGLNTNRLRNTTAPAVKGKPLCTRSPLRPGTDKKVDSVFSVQTKKREIVEEQHFLRISRFVSQLVF